MTPPGMQATHRRPVVAWLVTALALVLTIVLAGVLAALALRSPEASHVVEIGDRLPLQAPLYNGQAHELTVPGASVRVRVGTPVSQVDRGAVELAGGSPPDAAPIRAAEGARIVPVSWRVLPDTHSSAQDVRSVPIAVRLVAGEASAEVAAGSFTELLSPHGEVNLPSSIVGVDAGVELSDLRIEIDFDGATQTLDVATGEIDHGAAAGISTPVTSIASGCERAQDQCHLTASQAGARWRPSAQESVFSVSALTLYAYDTELGWADDGKRWAALDTTPPTIPVVVDEDGDERGVDRMGAVTITLDGAEPERSSGLGSAAAHRTGQGHAVFAVDADTPPLELKVRRDLTLTGSGSPWTVPLAATITLVQ